MENASKAIIMAGGILIGVIIMTIGVYIFTVFGATSKETQKEIDSRVLAEFNNNYIKYDGSKTCTIHDIVSLATFTKKANEEFEYTTADIRKPYYIEIYIDGCSGYKDKELSSLVQDDYMKLLNDYSTGQIYNKDTKKYETGIQYFSCKIEAYNNEKEYNRVKRVRFTKITN